MEATIDEDRAVTGRAERDAEFSEYAAARYQRLLRTAYLLSGNQHTAEDLVQGALANLYSAWDSVEGRDNVDAYVRRILVNGRNSLWRRPWRHRELTTDSLPDVAWEQEHAEGLDDELWSLVQGLPRRQRATIVLRYYEGLSEREIADALGVAPGTVKSQASRALASLRARLPDSLVPDDLARPDQTETP